MRNPVRYILHRNLRRSMHHNAHHSMCHVLGILCYCYYSSVASTFKFLHSDLLRYIDFMQRQSPHNANVCSQEIRVCIKKDIAARVKLGGLLKEHDHCNPLDMPADLFNHIDRTGATWKCPNCLLKQFQCEICGKTQPLQGDDGLPQVRHDVQTRRSLRLALGCNRN